VGYMMWSAHNGRVMGQPRTGRERLKIWTRNSWDRYDGAKLHFSRIHIVIVHSNNNNWENTLEKRKMKIKDESQRKSIWPRDLNRQLGQVSGGIEGFTRMAYENNLKKKGNHLQRKPRSEGLIVIIPPPRFRRWFVCEGTGCHHRI